MDMIGDKYVVVEPLMMCREAAGTELDNYLGFLPGDVVTVAEGPDYDGDVIAVRDRDGLEQYISLLSLVDL